MTTKSQIAEQTEAADRLRGMIKPGDTVHTILRHCSASGMSRSISLIGPETYDLTFWAARAMGDKIDQRRGGIKIGGVGMDMGFALVYNLSRTLWPDGYGCTGEGCRNNDHSNGDRDYTPHKSDAERIGADGKMCGCHRDHWHTDGGYALSQRWL